MTSHIAKTTALVAALMLGVASIPAYAIDINLGNGGASAGTGGTTGANNGTVTIDQDNGQLATFDSNGNPTNGGSQSDADVNLGSLLAGLDLGDVGLGDVGGVGGVGGGTGNDGGAGGANTGSGSGTGFQRIVASLSSGDRDTLKARCLGVLASPSTHKSDIVNFCKMIAKM